MKRGRGCESRKQRACVEVTRERDVVFCVKYMHFVEQKRSNLVQENSGEVFHGGEKRTGRKIHEDADRQL